MIDRLSEIKFSETFPSESNNNLSLFLWTPAAAKRIVNVRFLKFLSESRIQESAIYGRFVQLGGSVHAWRVIVDLMPVSRRVRPGFLFCACALAGFYLWTLNLCLY